MASLRVWEIQNHLVPKAKGRGGAVMSSFATGLSFAWESGGMECLEISHEGLTVGRRVGTGHARG